MPRSQPIRVDLHLHHLLHLIRQPRRHRLGGKLSRGNLRRRRRQIILLTSRPKIHMRRHLPSIRTVRRRKIGNKVQDQVTERNNSEVLRQPITPHWYWGLLVWCWVLLVAVVVYSSFRSDWGLGLLHGLWRVRIWLRSAKDACILQVRVPPTVG